MKIHKKSFFKDPENDKAWFENWVSHLETANNKQYARLGVETSLGYTHVWALNTEQVDLPALVIFPGARTTALFWDFDNGLEPLEQLFRIYLIETNGLPNLSDGNTPDIKKLDYGMWAAEVLENLKIKKAFVAGASFGGLICMKLSMVAPDLIQAVFLLNPGCLQAFSLTFKNLYYNLLPILRPTRLNVAKFLDEAILNKPFHKLSDRSEKMLIDYELFALTRYQDRSQKPYFMGNELKKATSDTYLLVGDHDLLFPYKNSIKNARNLLPSLKEVKVLPHVGHGIETEPAAIQQIIRLTNARKSF